MSIEDKIAALEALRGGHDQTIRTTIETTIFGDVKTSLEWWIAELKARKHMRDMDAFVDD